MAEQRKKLRLGELLVQQGLLSADQLGIALAEQRQNNIPLGRMLVRLGFITEASIRDIMARTVGQEDIDLAQVVADHEALKLVPQDFARRHRMLPIAYDVELRVLSLATPEIFNVVAFDQLRAMLGPSVEIKTHLAGEAQLEDYIDQFYGHELSVDGILQEISTGEIDYGSLQAGGAEYTQPMVRLVNALLVDAVKRGASDIHFEPEYAFLRIRYRIDCVLETVRSLHKTFMPGISVRIQVISELNISEARAPQDGRLSLTLNGRPIDFASRHTRRFTARTSCCAFSTAKIDHQHRQAQSRQAETRAAEPEAGATGWHPGRDRTHRQRKDHHAVFVAGAGQR